MILIAFFADTFKEEMKKWATPRELNVTRRMRRDAQSSNEAHQRQFVIPAGCLRSLPPLYPQLLKMRVGRRADDGTAQWH